MRRVKPYTPPSHTDLDTWWTSGLVEQMRIEAVMWAVYRACESDVEEASAVVKGILHRQAVYGECDDTN